MARDSTDRREVFVKIDGDKEPTNPNATGTGSSPIWRGSSYSFWTDDKSGKNNQKGGDESFDFMRGAESKEADPPTKLIGKFLHQQKASAEISLDMDLGMVELQSQPPSRGVTTVSETATPGTGSHRVTFEENGDGNPDAVRRRQRDSRSPHSKDDDSSDDDKDNGRGGEVVKCTSNKTFQRNPSLMRSKTKSRLLDLPPTPPAPAGATDKKSGRMPRSGQLKSGLFGKSPGQHSGAREEEEDEDPFLDEDLPENYMKDQFNIWILLEWVSLISIVTFLVCSLTIPHLKSKNLWDLPLWKWELMVLVLICGRLVSSWIVRIVVFCIERNFLLRKRVLYFVYGVRKAVQHCLWLGLVLIAWHFLFDKKVERETRSTTLRFVTRILVCLLVGFVVWLIKTLFVKVLASSFHMSTYFDRIHESLFNQYVIETLSGPPVVEIQQTEEDEEERIANEVKSLQNAGVKIPPGLIAATCPSPHKKKPIGNGVLQEKSPRMGKSPILSRVSSSKERDEKGITIDHLHRLNTKNVSAWRMKKLMNIIRNGAISTLDEQIQDSTMEDDENGKQIQSEYEAKVAARKIFHNVAKPGSRYIYSEDIMRFMHEDETSKTMTLFEGVSDNHRISKSSLKNWVVNAFRERRALALTLNDTKTAVNRLHHFVNVLVGIIIVIIWLLILGIATSKFLIFVSSQLVLVAFIFGNSCKTVFEAIIFLFVMHPFDVGDRCEIDDVQMVVEEMNILTTVFLRYDNQKIIYPNSLLATKAISNYYRSPDMGEAVEFWVHISTPPDKITAMKQRIVSYIENRKDHWYPSPMIVFRDMEGLNSVKMAVWPTHRMNHQDMGERFVRRGHLIEEIARICRELDIQFRLYPLDINVRSLPAAPNVMSERVPSSWMPRGT